MKELFRQEVFCYAEKYSWWLEPYPARKARTMKIQKLAIFLGLLFCASCTHETTIPLGNDLLEVDTSVAAVYGRAGAQRIAMKKAAKATIDMGYDKFIVVNNNGWNETTAQGFSQGTANVNNNGGSAQQTSSFGETRHPEAKIIVKMFHNGDKGSDKAVDARQFLALQEQ